MSDSQQDTRPERTPSGYCPACTVARRIDDATGAKND